MKRVFLVILAMLLLLPGCSLKEAVTDPTPTAIPSPSAEPVPTPTPEPTPAPTPIVFTSSVERTFSGLMGIYDIKSPTPQDAVCYDALCYYNKEAWGGEDSPTLYALAMLDDATYTDADGNLNYIGMVAQYGYYDLGARLAQGIEPLHSNPLYPNFQPIRFVVRPSDLWCLAVEDMWDGGDPAVRAAQIFGEPNAALTETYIEKGFETDWLRDMARPVTPIDPDELLELYLERTKDER